MLVYHGFPYYERNVYSRTKVRTPRRFFDNYTREMVEKSTTKPSMTQVGVHWYLLEVYCFAEIILRGGESRTKENNWPFEDKTRTAMT